MYTEEDLLLFAKKHGVKLRNFFRRIPGNAGKSFTKFKKHELHAIIFLSIEYPFELCHFFQTPFSKFQNTINDPIYAHYQIAKKKGGHREIFAPPEELKKYQKRLNYFLQAYYLSVKPKEVHGFVINPLYRGIKCNITENAKPHVNKKYVLNIDLKDFFPGITAKRVKEIFSSPTFNFSEQISTALTLLTTFEGKLPIGAPTSPVISNFICKQLDADLIEFSETNSLSYTRYADDLTFSSNDLISNDIILDIVNLIQKNNFKINEKKLRLRTSNRRQTVTGITVNKKVNVDRKLLKKIRAMLHDLSRNGAELASWRHFKFISRANNNSSTTFIKKLNGYINFVGQVRGLFDPLYLRLKISFDKEYKIFVSLTTHPKPLS